MRHLLHLPLLVDALHPVDLLVREEPRERFGSFGGGIITCAMGFAAAGKRAPGTGGVDISTSPSLAPGTGGAGSTLSIAGTTVPSSFCLLRHTYTPTMQLNRRGMVIPRAIPTTAPPPPPPPPPLLAFGGSQHT